MLFRSYDTNSLGLFKTPYQDPDEDSSVLTENGPVCLDPISKRVRFAIKVLFLDDLIGSNCCYPSLLSCREWRRRC